jgi:transcriptional regulator with XRE-family HTH domain
MTHSICSFTKLTKELNSISSTKLPLNSLIYDKRKIKGLTQKELGDKIGVSQSCISQYESGEREPECKIFIKLVLELKIDLNNIKIY